VDAAVRKALAFLMSQQQESGSIHDKKNQTAMTALSILAFCAGGHQPVDKSPEGKLLRRAVEFILQDERTDENGYYGEKDGSRMYGHGIVSLTLAELLGMGVSNEQDQRIRERLTKAVQVILRAQDQKKPDNRNHYGGWRYAPHANDSDLSVSIWQLLTLRAAANAGLDVPDTAIDKAVRYLKTCFTRRDNKKDGIEMGACSYQPDRGPTYASAAAGLLALQVCGEYEAREAVMSAEWLKTHDLEYDNRHFFYGTYYYAQGLYQRGGEYAEHARREIETMLLPRQEEDGSWKAGNGEERNVGQVYATAMAVLSLSVKYHLLPIYQR
jgi:hypothetical protein